MVTFFLSHHNFPYIRTQLRVGSTTQHHAVQIMIALRKQARPNLSIRRQTHPAAMSAERSRHRRDNPNLAHAVIERKSPCSLTCGVRRQLNQRTKRIQPIDKLIHANHGLGLPAAVFLQRHELNKPDDDALAA